jgi:membrane associated rhomboid family serine protease
MFETDGILVRKEYFRLLSSAFLHGSWLHLILNMAALYSFSFSVGYVLGVRNFLLIYFGSLLAGNLLSLYFHRNHGDYSAIGASGAVSGVIFASIAIFPESRMGIIFLPFQMPAWLFGTLFILVSIYGVKSSVGNIGHDAHLGGAIAGILLCICLEPRILTIAPLGGCGHPHALRAVYGRGTAPARSHAGGKLRGVRAETPFGVPVVKQQIRNEAELDRLLEKVQSKGLNSLSKREKATLDQLSKNL